MSVFIFMLLVYLPLLHIESCKHSHFLLWAAKMYGHSPGNLQDLALQVKTSHWGRDLLSKVFHSRGCPKEFSDLLLFPPPVYGKRHSNRHAEGGGEEQSKDSKHWTRAVHGALKARMLKWLAISFSSGPCFVRTLHHDPSVLDVPTRHGS